jgi:hypothetical protein
MAQLCVMFSQDAWLAMEYLQVLCGVLLQRSLVSLENFGNHHLIKDIVKKLFAPVRF